MSSYVVVPRCALLSAALTVAWTVTLAFALLLLALPSLPTQAADIAVIGRPGPAVKAVEYDVVIPRRARHRHWGCPDRYSCMALYGAYGPYGGVGYWGAYTGWYR